MEERERMKKKGFQSKPRQSIPISVYLATLHYTSPYCLPRCHMQMHATEFVNMQMKINLCPKTAQTRMRPFFPAATDINPIISKLKGDLPGESKKVARYYSDYNQP